MKWEIQRIRKETNGAYDDEDSANNGDVKVGPGEGLKRAMTDDPNETRKKLAIGENIPQQQPLPGTSISTAGVVQKMEGANRPIDKVHCDTVLNFLIRLACQVNDAQTTPGIVSPGESLSRRCVMLLKMAMKPDVWPQPFDLKLGWIDKVFTSIELPQANFGNIYTGLELLTFLITILKKDQILAIIRPIQRGLSACVTCQNTRVIRLMHTLLSRLMNIFPTDTHHKHEELETLYTTVSKMIQEGLTSYEKKQF